MKRAINMLMNKFMGRTIVVIDDSKCDCAVVKRRLLRRLNNIRVLTYHSSHAALSYFSRLKMGLEPRPEAIILDCDLGPDDMDGYELSAVFGTHSDSFKTILYSGNLIDLDKRKAFNVDASFVKTASADDLIDYIERDLSLG